MAIYRLIKNGVTVNTIVAEADFMPLIADQYDTYEEVVPKVVEYVEPVAPVDPVVTSVTPIEFKLLFTSAERVAINAAKTDDPILIDFYSIVEDPRLIAVNLTLGSTIAGIEYLVSKNLITAERKTQILAGQLM